MEIASTGRIIFTQGESFELYFVPEWKSNKKNVLEVFIKNEYDETFGEIILMKTSQSIWYLDSIAVFAEDEKLHNQLKGLGRKLLCFALTVILESYPLATEAKMKLQVGGLLGLPAHLRGIPTSHLINFYQSFGFKIDSDDDYPKKMTANFIDILNSCRN